ncbi:hypothetical protein RISK_001164 [Rhodopirellula islandica]|uniref:Uncharacterized protein n=1 Tax=Rhodopirellula islandica TaxID=595434 RepID=A0A0J1BJX3_RHOIS|nr:hypothetical protein RISK_001164 [Rhodopirellula islandica]
MGGESGIANSGRTRCLVHYGLNLQSRPASVRNDTTTS